MSELKFSEERFYDPINSSVKFTCTTGERDIDCRVPSETLCDSFECFCNEKELLRVFDENRRSIENTASVMIKEGKYDDNILILNNILD
ncbi:MAG: DUF1488 family protein [Desulfatibacillum sp.]|nr:DUF1488 family protein [Desulfatibacillum sp.]